MMTLKVNWRLWMKRLIAACDVWLNNSKLIPWLLAVRHVCGGREADSQIFFYQLQHCELLGAKLPCTARLKVVFFVLYSLTVQRISDDAAWRAQLTVTCRTNCSLCSTLSRGALLLVCVTLLPRARAMHRHCTPV